MNINAAESWIFKATDSVLLVCLTDESQNLPVKAAHILKNILLKGAFFSCMELWKVHLILQAEKSQKNHRKTGKLSEARWSGADCIRLKK